MNVDTVHTRFLNAKLTFICMPVKATAENRNQPRTQGAPPDRRRARDYINNSYGVDIYISLFSRVERGFDVSCQLVSLNHIHQRSALESEVGSVVELPMCRKTSYAQRNDNSPGLLSGRMAPCMPHMPHRTFRITDKKTSTDEFIPVRP